MSESTHTTSWSRGLWGAARPLIANQTGKLLAARLGLPFVDSDEQLARRHGLTAREFAERSGVAALHVAEVAALLEAVAAPARTVVAAAAAVADSPEALAALQTGGVDVVVLACAPELLAGRIPSGGHRRDVSAQELSALTAARHRRLLTLEPVAVVDTTELEPEQVATIVVTALEHGRAT
jgi:shikimate kinase